MADWEKVIKGLGEILVYCHEQFGENDHDVQAQLTRMNQTAKDAIDLLKAQEPGMVNVTITQSDGWKEGTCPFCGMKVDSFYNWSFCGTCGKGLKWK